MAIFQKRNLIISIIDLETGKIDFKCSNFVLNIFFKQEVPPTYLGINFPSQMYIAEIINKVSTSND